MYTVIVLEAPPDAGSALADVVSGVNAGSAEPVITPRRVGVGFAGDICAGDTLDAHTTAISAFLARNGGTLRAGTDNGCTVVFDIAIEGGR